MGQFSCRFRLLASTWCCRWTLLLNVAVVVFRNTVDVALKCELIQRFKLDAQRIVTLERRALCT
jgi:hypothetical protein